MSSIGSLRSFLNTLTATEVHVFVAAHLPNPLDRKAFDEATKSCPIDELVPIATAVLAHLVPRFPTTQRAMVAPPSQTSLTAPTTTIPRVPGPVPIEYSPDRLPTVPLAVIRPGQYSCIANQTNKTNKTRKR